MTRIVWSEHVAVLESIAGGARSQEPAYLVTLNAIWNRHTNRQYAMRPAHKYRVPHERGDEPQFHRVIPISTNV